MKVINYGEFLNERFLDRFRKKQEEIIEIEEKIYDKDLKELVDDIITNFSAEKLRKSHYYYYNNEGKIQVPSEFIWGYDYFGKKIRITLNKSKNSLKLEIGDMDIDNSDYSENILKKLTDFFIEKEIELEDVKRQIEITKRKNLFNDLSKRRLEGNAKKYNL